MKRPIHLLLALILAATSFLSAQQTIGLFLNDSLSVNGYTLFTNNRISYLIDNCGFVVNQWESDFKSNSAIYLLENGNLLRSCRVPGNFSGGGIGGRLELFSWEGELLWSYNYASPEHHQHHDIEPMPNGNILVLAWEARTNMEAVQAGRNPSNIGMQGIWPEQIVEIEMVDNDSINIVWEWHVWDHLIQDFDSTKANYGVVAEHPELIDINHDQFSGMPIDIPDWIHANAIEYHPGLDQIAISLRHFNEIWIIDHSTTTDEAAGHTGGNAAKGGDLLYRWGNPEVYDRGDASDQTLWGQHDISWITEPDHPHFGKLLVYNNGQGRPGSDYSSIDIWTPPVDIEGRYIIDENNPFGPAQPEWTYAAPGFYSPNISGVHALPYGNLFICEGTDGRLFEINSEKEVVWEYINPVSSINGPLTQGLPPMQNATFRAQRYPSDYPAFNGRELTPGEPIELDPLPSDCVIYDQPPVSTVAVPPLSSAWLRSNPVTDQLIIENRSGQMIHAAIYDVTGKLWNAVSSTDTEIIMDVIGGPAGFYVLRIYDENRIRFTTQKFIKQ